MVIRIGSISEAWRALTKIANASEEVEYDRAKPEFETLEMDASESVAEFFTRVHIVLMELERHQIPIPAREIQRIVLGSLSVSRMKLVCMRIKVNVISKTWRLGLSVWRSSGWTRSRRALPHMR